MTRVLEDAVRAAPPWAERRRGRHDGDRKRTGSALHYRGWTLVDYDGWRWAAKDGTNERRRVCREGLEFGEAKRRFHDVVDSETRTGA